MTANDDNGSSARDQLFSALRGWHTASGRPSMRAIAAGSGLSHTTVHSILTGQHLPAWPRLAPVVQYLGGDMAVAKQLWVLATQETGVIQIRWRSNETDVLCTLAKMLGQLSPLARTRILAYLNDRFGTEGDS
jgi:hypothetical protein